MAVQSVDSNEKKIEVIEMILWPLFYLKRIYKFREKAFVLNELLGIFILPLPIVFFLLGEISTLFFMNWYFLIYASTLLCCDPSLRVFLWWPRSLWLVLTDKAGDRQEGFIFMNFLVVAVGYGSFPRGIVSLLIFYYLVGVFYESNDYWDNSKRIILPEG